MFGLTKKAQSHIEVSYQNHQCECGNDKFRHVTKLQFMIRNNEGCTSRKPYTDWDNWYFECTKCGMFYNRYGEKVE